jgi:transketolase C-terminal domain/subunit
MEILLGYLYLIYYYIKKKVRSVFFDEIINFIDNQDTRDPIESDMHTKTANFSISFPERHINTSMMIVLLKEHISSGAFSLH